MKTKILQITSGRGPAECCWVVAQVLKYILKEARDLGFNAEVLHRVEGFENGTLISAVVRFEGKTLDDFVKNWIGTVQWIGQSQFRKYHKRKNWFVGVNELQFSNENYTIKPSDLKFETSRSSGAGGQHVNKVETAVRVVHLPTGATTTCSESRSQHQNRKKALEKLKVLLKLQQLNKAKTEAVNNWQNHNELKRENPVKVFLGSDFKTKKKDKNFKKQRNQLKNDLRNTLKN